MSEFRHILQHHRLRAELRGLKNCHVQGLTSIMLHDEPGNRMRLFYAGTDHKLYTHPEDADAALAAHPHHCDITLVHLFGEVLHTVYSFVQDDVHGQANKCRYQSAITGDGGSLQATGEIGYLLPQSHNHLDQEGHIFSPAKDVHGIYVPRNREAAWLVMEGKEDPTYESVCYTANPNFNPEGMYVPMDRAQCSAVLGRVALHLIAKGK